MSDVAIECGGFLSLQVPLRPQWNMRQSLLFYLGTPFLEQICWNCCSMAAAAVMAYSLLMRVLAYSY
jgi:hypothetical protein